jgi:hypothetical protein
MGVFVTMSAVFAVMFLKSTYQEIKISSFGNSEANTGYEMARFENLTMLTRFGEFSEVPKKLVPNTKVYSLPQIMQKFYLIFLIERVISSGCIVLLAPSMAFISACIAVV